MGQSSEVWLSALRTYCYPVILSRYEGNERFPNHFKQVIPGNRDTTIEFENYFRKNASDSIAAYCEVVFWKLYNFEDQTTASMIIEWLRLHGEPVSLLSAIERFINSQEIRIENLIDLRKFLGLRGGLAVALTFPAFANPDKFPMVDRRVAGWVNLNSESHSRERSSKLTRFGNGTGRPEPLTDADFSSYAKWVLWCREMASILSEKTSIAWRTRDVEMAVFSAQQQRLSLEPL